MDARGTRAGLSEVKAIISLQSIRQRGNRELIEASPPQIDLLIVDEAHHLRNPETLTHRTVDSLAVGAAAILFLTATPIHLGSENLFNLLTILEPGRFGDVAAFNELLVANEPIVEAERLARLRPIPADEILDRLHSAENGRGSRFFEGNFFLREAVALLEERSPLQSEDLLHLERHLKDLNLLSDVVTRTRKRDVFEEQAVRTPRVKTVVPTPAEEEFYAAVTAFIRRQHGGGWSSSAMLAAITAQRQVASCMHASRGKFLDQAYEALADPEESDLDLEAWFLPDDARQSVNPPERVIQAAKSLGEDDTKFQALMEELRRLEEEEPGRKLLVFAYFKATLHYLHRRLEAQGFRSTYIDGTVPSVPNDPARDERGQRIRRFREDPDLQILLCSEVGSEGLDFQFCHILINYDLPWNPMRVEQRIGRLDRLGQKADRIIIVNLSMAGTIEHRILERLYKRIGIFRRSLGDLEAILGEEIQTLTRDLFSRHLTPAEEEARIEQAARVIEARGLELERLERESEQFVGRDAFFDQQLQRAREGGEVLGGSDLHSFLEEFLEQQYPKSGLQESGTTGVFELEVGTALDMALRGVQRSKPVMLRMLHRLDQGRGRLRVTFDSSLAFADPGLELLAPHHPVLQLAVEHYRGHVEQLHPVVALRMRADEVVSPGAYVLLVYDLTISSGRTRHRLEPYLLREDGEPLPAHQTSLAFGRIMREGDDWVPPGWDVGAAREILDEAERQFLRRTAGEKHELQQRQSALVQAKLTSLRTTYERRMSQKQDLSDVSSRGKEGPEICETARGNDPKHEGGIRRT